MTAWTLVEFKKLLIETLRLESLTPETISDDEPLIGGRLGLDSIDALEIVVALEKRLGITMRAQEIDQEAYRSVAAMFRHVEARLGEVQVPQVPRAG
jgi:acyl carrier protein